MKATLDGCKIIFTREQGDPKFHGIRQAKGEHGLLHFIKEWLNARGFGLAKKLVQKDGHLMGDQYQPYLRTRKPSKGQPHICIVSGFYAIRGANEDWNEGEVALDLHLDIFGKGVAEEMRDRVAAMVAGTRKVRIQVIKVYDVEAAGESDAECLRSAYGMQSSEIEEKGELVDVTTDHAEIAERDAGAATAMRTKARKETKR